MTRIYLASPFFNDKEIEYVARVKGILESKGLTVFSPMDNQYTEMVAGGHEWSISTFRNDVKFIDWCDVVVGIYHGNYSDSGTAWELGYAYGTQKPVITVHVGENSNLMVHEASHANLTLDQLVNYDFIKLPSSFYEGDMF